MKKISMAAALSLAAAVAHSGQLSDAYAPVQNWNPPAATARASDDEIMSKVTETMYDLSHPVAYVGNRDSFRAITSTECPVKGDGEWAGFAVFYSAGKFTAACWGGPETNAVTITQVASDHGTWKVVPGGLSIREPSSDYKPTNIPRYTPPQ